MILRTALPATLAVLLLTACGGVSSAPEAGPVAVDADGHTLLLVNGNDAMRFDRQQLKAKAGAPIKLILRHSGTMPRSAMGHNIVVVKPGTDMQQFLIDAASADSSAYIPANHSDMILAHTRMLGGGEVDTVLFTIQEPGAYPFVCSFPGHGSMMKGVLTIE